MSIYNYYKNAIAIRNKYPEIARGEQTYEELPDGDIMVMGKVYEGQITYVVYNNSETIKTIDLTQTALDGKKIYDSLQVMPSMEQESVLENNELTLLPFEICIIK